MQVPSTIADDEVLYLVPLDAPERNDGPDGAETHHYVLLDCKPAPGFAGGLFMLELDSDLEVIREVGDNWFESVDDFLADVRKWRLEAYEPGAVIPGSSEADG